MTTTAPGTRADRTNARLLFAGTMIAFFFFTSQFLQGVHGWSPLQAGLAFLPMTLLQFATSLAVSRLTRRFGPAPLLVVGLGLVLLGMIWISRISADTGYVSGIVGSLVLIGPGQGFVFGPLTGAGIAGVEAVDGGAASGLVNTAHQLGSTLGVAVLTPRSASSAPPCPGGSPTPTPAAPSWS